MSIVAPPESRRTLLPAAADVTAPALISHDRAMTYDDLAAAVRDTIGELPDARTRRLLVHLPMDSTLDAIVGYLAVLYAGHVALVTAPNPSSGDILDRYAPALTLAGGRVAAGPGIDDPHTLLHPDLACLLSTSGSTGSPKLVRLSRTNLRSNADAIVAALGLRSDDRGITALPLHYCYGLSVLNAHLRAGASVLVHEGSVQEPDFWSAVDTHAVTNVPVVPHSLRLMLGAGALDQPHPSVRLITQAGGRLPADTVAGLARRGEEQGWELAVMYGQTEATARIAVLPPHLAQTHSDAVGFPVPGTTARLDPEVAEATEPGVGELVVQGPGVMLGYATHPDDLALGAMTEELRTGDLATIDPSGLIRIVGRRSGFVKVMGLRVDIARVEAVLTEAGHTVCVTGDDAGLRVAVAPMQESTSDAAADVRRLTAQVSGVGPAAVQVAAVPLALLDNGKVDRIGCDALVRAASADTPDPERSPALLEQVAATLADVLGMPALNPDKSFAQQGGDSLSHVQASVRLTDLLGDLPRDWHHRTLRDLATRSDPATRSGPARTTPTGPGRDTASPSGTSTAARSSRRSARRSAYSTSVRIETSIVLRALAVLTILGTHANLFWVPGGAHTLLAVAGYNAARFGHSAPTVSERWRGTARLVVAVAVPTALVALTGLLTTGRYGWANVAVANWLAGDVTYGARNELWFVDALVASVLIMAAVLSVPAVARAYRRDPWRVAVVVTALALVPRFVILAIGDGTLRGIAPTVFWLFAAGAALAHADTRRRTRLTLALVLIGGVTFFPDDPIRNATILAGIALLGLVPLVRLPRRLQPLLAQVASASLAIYLVQFQVFDLLPEIGGRLPAASVRVLAALLVGCLVWRLTEPGIRRLQRLIPLHPTRKDN